MNLTVPKNLHAFINTYGRFIVCGHEEPDGDCLGAQLALCNYLERSGKETLAVSPGPFNRPETEHLEPLFHSEVENEFITEDTAVIITDCSTIERIGRFQDVLSSFPIAVIDHHDSGNQFGNARYIIPKAPSTTILIYQLFAEAGYTPTPQIAEYLLFGIATDTGFFRHLGPNAPETFEITAELVRAGASPNGIHRKIFGSRTLSSRRLLGVTLHRTESYYNGKLLLTYQTLEDIKAFGKGNKDSDTLYMLLQGIRDVEVVALIREEKAGECSVGLRSNTVTDVGKVALTNGGGGHKKAAGFTYFGKRSDLTRKLISQFEFLDGQGHL